MPSFSSFQPLKLSSSPAAVYDRIATKSETCFSRHCHVTRRTTTTTAFPVKPATPPPTKTTTTIISTRTKLLFLVLMLCTARTSARVTSYAGVTSQQLPPPHATIARMLALISRASNLRRRLSDVQLSDTQLSDAQLSDAQLSDTRLSDAESSDADRTLPVARSPTRSWPLTSRMTSRARAKRQLQAGGDRRRKVVYCSTHQMLEILPDGTVRGSPRKSIYTNIEIRSTGKGGIVSFYGVAAQRYLSVTKRGRLKSSTKYRSESCNFREGLTESLYTTYSFNPTPRKRSSNRWYLAISKSGRTRKRETSSSERSTWFLLLNV